MTFLRHRIVVLGAKAGMKLLLAVRSNFKDLRATHAFAGHESYFIAVYRDFLFHE